MELVDLVVQDGVGDSPTHSRLEATLHNTGDRLVVINQARLKIRHVYELPICFNQGNLPLSNTYGVLLDPDAPPATIVKVPLHQQVGGDEADRFGISLGVRGNENGELVGSYIFELDVSLLSDGPQGNFALGRALVVLPEVPSLPGQYYLERGTPQALDKTFNPYGVPPRDMWKEMMPCWRSNTQVFRRVFSSDAALSPQLAAISVDLITPTFSVFEATAG